MNLRSRSALLFLAAAALAGCPRPKAVTPPPAAPAPPPHPAPAILRLSQRNEPGDLDPALAALPDDFFIIRALSEGLVVPGPAGTPAAAAAERWTTSPDGLTWTFFLRPDARWSNGEPVTAADFVASYRRALLPATAAPKADLFFAVRNARAFATGTLRDFSAVGFAAPDAHTLVVTLERPTPDLLAYAATGVWIPVNPRVVERFGGAWTQPEAFVGNGPFVLREWIVVDRSATYHDAVRVRLDEIHFVHFDDRETEDRAYRDGQLDTTMEVPVSRVAVYARERPAELQHTPLAETRYLAFNVNRPPLSDPRVRRALALAIDRGRLVRDVLQGGQEPAYRLLPPGLRPAGEVAPAAEVAALDPAGSVAEARALLAAAGFPGGRGFPPLELSGWAATPVLEAVQAMWKKALGVTVLIAVRDAKAHVTALRAGRYDIAFITLIPDVAAPLAALERFTTGSPDNYPHWSDGPYDQAVAAARRQADRGGRLAAMQAAEARLLEQQPLAPLYFNVQNWLKRTRVRGWRQDPLWTRNYVGLYLEGPP